MMEATIRAAAAGCRCSAGSPSAAPRMACRYARDMERLGADGLMVLPAMVYKSDPRETVAHFRAVARSSGLPVLCLQQPDRLRRRPDAGDVRRAGRRADAGRDQGILRRRPPHHRHHQPRRRPLHALLRRRRPGPGERDARRRGWVAGLGLRSRGKTSSSGTSPPAGRWDEARALYRWYMPLLHLDTHVKFVQYIKLAIQECGLGARVGPSAAPAAGGRGTGTGARDHPQRDRDAAETCNTSRDSPRDTELRACADDRSEWELFGYPASLTPDVRPPRKPASVSVLSSPNSTPTAPCPTRRRRAAIAKTVTAISAIAFA